VIIFLAVLAIDLGRSGQTFPVQEQSLLEYIVQQASQSKFDKEGYGKEVEEYIKNPTPVAGLSAAVSKRSFLFNPTHIVEEDIEVDGELFAKAGDKINPLDWMKFDETLLFFDGSDKGQLAWAKKARSNAKWILVKGSPLDLEEKEKRPVYFDQSGIYTARFQIEHFPAKVIQQGNQLVIEELVVDEEGDEKP
jgi:conjugal transfer pilus assembly protein TraW